jgi:hypothetical protein
MQKGQLTFWTVNPFTFATSKTLLSRLLTTLFFKVIVLLDVIPASSIILLTEAVVSGESGAEKSLINPEKETLVTDSPGSLIVILEFLGILYVLIIVSYSYLIKQFQ